MKLEPVHVDEMKLCHILTWAHSALCLTIDLCSTFPEAVWCVGSYVLIVDLSTEVHTQSRVCNGSVPSASLTLAVPQTCLN